MILATSMRDAATSRQRAQELIALSSEHSYQYWVVHWRISLALTGISAASADAEIDRALQEAASAIELMRTAYGSNLQNSRFLGWTASACLDHGRLELARRLLDEAVQVTAGEGERYWVSELHRLRARLLRAEGAPDDRDRRGPSTPPSTSPGPRARRLRAARPRRSGELADRLAAPRRRYAAAASAAAAASCRSFCLNRIRNVASAIAAVVPIVSRK